MPFVLMAKEPVEIPKLTIKQCRAYKLTFGKWNGAKIGSLVQADLPYLKWLSKQHDKYPIPAHCAERVYKAQQKAVAGLSVQIEASINKATKGFKQAQEAILKAAESTAGMSKPFAELATEFTKALKPKTEGFLVPASGGGVADVGQWLQSVTMSLTGPTIVEFKIPGKWLKQDSAKVKYPNWSLAKQDSDCPLDPQQQSLEVAEDAYTVVAEIKPGWAVTKLSTGGIAVHKGPPHIPLVSWSSDPGSVTEGLEKLKEMAAQQTPPNPPWPGAYASGGVVKGGGFDAGAFAKNLEWLVQNEPIKYPEKSPMPPLVGGFGFDLASGADMKVTWEPDLLFPDAPPIDAPPITSAEKSKLLKALPLDAKKIVLKAGGFTGSGETGGAMLGVVSSEDGAVDVGSGESFTMPFTVKDGSTTYTDGLAAWTEHEKAKWQQGAVPSYQYVEHLLSGDVKALYPWQKQLVTSLLPSNYGSIHPADMEFKQKIKDAQAALKVDTIEKPPKSWKLSELEPHLKKPNPILLHPKDYDALKAKPWWMVEDADIPWQFVNTGHYGQAGHHKMIDSAALGYPGVWTPPQPQFYPGSRYLEVLYGGEPKRLVPVRLVFLGGLAHGKVLKVAPWGDIEIPEDPAVPTPLLTHTLSSMDIFHSSQDLDAALKHPSVISDPMHKKYHQTYGFVGIAGPPLEYLKEHAGVSMLYSELTYLFKPQSPGEKQPDSWKQAIHGLTEFPVKWLEDIYNPPF